MNGNGQTPKAARTARPGRFFVLRSRIVIFFTIRPRAHIRTNVLRNPSCLSCHFQPVSAPLPLRPYNGPFVALKRWKWPWTGQGRPIPGRVRPAESRGGQSAHLRPVGQRPDSQDGQRPTASMSASAGRRAVCTVPGRMAAQHSQDAMTAHVGWLTLMHTSGRLSIVRCQMMLGVGIARTVFLAVGEHQDSPAKCVILRTNIVSEHPFVRTDFLPTTIAKKVLWDLQKSFRRGSIS